MTTYGDWQTDADLAWVSAGHVQTGTVNGDYAVGVSQAQVGEAVTSHPNGAWASALAEAWTNDETCGAETSFHDGPYLRVADNFDGVGNPTGTTATWTSQWLTLVSQDLTVNSSTLPASVYTDGAFVDPTVSDVEWEPTSTALDQKLSVKLMGSYGAGFVLGEQYYLHGPAPYSGSAPYVPGYMTAATLAGTPVLGTITGVSDPSTNGGVGGSVDITSLGIPLSGTYALPLAMLDQCSETQTPPAYNAGSSAARFSQFTADLMRAFRPRYRLIYRDPPGALPPIRRLHRGDVQAIGGVPRSVQKRSRQASLRRGTTFS